MIYLPNSTLTLFKLHNLGVYDTHFFGHSLLWIFSERSIIAIKQWICGTLETETNAWRQQQLIDEALCDSDGNINGSIIMMRKWGGGCVCLRCIQSLSCSEMKMLVSIKSDWANYSPKKIFYKKATALLNYSPSFKRGRSIQFHSRKTLLLRSFHSLLLN